MKRLLILISCVFLTFGVSAAQFSKAEKTQIQSIIHKYLIDNPEVLVQMSQELQQKQYNQMQGKALDAIKDNEEAIFNPKGTSAAGNPNGKVTAVEFFDYQCVHCANFHKQGVFKNLIKANPELRVVYKEFPIFGDASMYASKAAMAAKQQGKYLEMRNGIFATHEIEGKLKPADIDKVAEKIGLNMKKYHAYIKSDAGKKIIDADFKLAQALGIQGTPSFIVAPTPKVGNDKGKTTFIPGLVSPEQLQKAVTDAE